MPLSDDPAESHELILFLGDGWLSRLEIVYYEDQPPRSFPDPSMFEPARTIR
jgi:hypothetical protein